MSPCSLYELEPGSQLQRRSWDLSVLPQLSNSEPQNLSDLSVLQLVARQLSCRLRCMTYWISQICLKAILGQLQQKINCEPL